MGPKKHVNEKAEAARDRKAVAKDDAKKKAAKDAEDAIWSAAGEGQRTKAQAKREADAEKKAETAARKAELKRLQEEEEAAMTRPKAAPKANRVSGPKPARFSHMLPAPALQVQARRDVTADSYSRLVDAENANRQEDTVEARSMEQAIDALQSIKVADASPADKHPEKQSGQSWQAPGEHLQLKVLARLGSGGNGEVYKVELLQHTTTGLPVDDACPASASKAFCDGGNVQELLWDDAPSSDATALQPDRAWDVMVSMMLALTSLHKAGECGRDATGMVQDAGAAHAQPVANPSLTPTGPCNTAACSNVGFNWSDLAGTALYQAPEQVLKQRRLQCDSPLKIDTWQLGCLLLQLRIGALLFPHLLNMQPAEAAARKSYAENDLDHRPLLDDLHMDSDYILYGPLCDADEQAGHGKFGVGADDLVVATARVGQQLAAMLTESYGCNADGV
eukprot:gene5480-5715_t